MKEKNLISVIIATYNAEKTLLNALQSVKKQTYPNLELVIIDGCSKDNTIKIANDFEFENKLIISEPDKGIYDALNKGVKAAHGEWIYVLGADDELLPEGLSLLIHQNDKCDCVYGDVLIKKNKDEIILYESKPVNSLIHTMCASHQGMIMRKKMIMNLGGFDLQFSISADYELALRSYLAGYKFKQSHVVVAIFSVEGNSSHITFNVPVEQYKIFKKNKANRFPLLFVIWNLIKRYIRIVYDPKPKFK